MATNLIKLTIQFRRDTTANWEAHKDIVPAAGEPCFDVELGTLKIGDGKKSYAELEPINGAKLSADEKSIILKDGVFKLAGFDAAEVGAYPVKTENGIEWVVPSDEAIVKLQAAVEALQKDVKTAQDDIVVLKSGADTMLSKIGIIENKIDGTGEGTVDAKISAKIDAWAKTVTANGTIDTIQELFNYVADHGAEFNGVVNDIADLKDKVGSKPVIDQINEAINNSGHMSKAEAVDTLLSKVEAAATLQRVKYEIVSKPEGTLVDYRDKEIRVMCPADTKWVKQTVGGTGNANMYYMGFKAYAPAGAVSFKEGDRGVIVDEMFDFNGSFAGTDEFGRKYSICWLALASYDPASDTWSYFGKSSSVSKYIGWTYCVEWYDANGKVISSDSIRINLSNESCHSNIEPYYMAGYVKEVAVNGTVLEMIGNRVNVTIPEIKGSDEIAVAEDGTLSIKSISFDKIEQGNMTLVMDGGSAV